MRRVLQELLQQKKRRTERQSEKRQLRPRDQQAPPLTQREVQLALAARLERAVLAVLLAQRQVVRPQPDLLHYLEIMVVQALRGMAEVRLVAQAEVLQRQLR